MVAGRPQYSIGGQLRRQPRRRRNFSPMDWRCFGLHPPWWEPGWWLPRAQQVGWWQTQPGWLYEHRNMGHLHGVAPHILMPEVRNGAVHYFFFFFFLIHMYSRNPHTVLETHTHNPTCSIYTPPYPTVTVTIGQWQQAQPEAAPTGV